MRGIREPNIEIEMVPGRLAGMGRQGDCVVAARKVWVPETDAFEYKTPRIYGAPDDLPDGQYEVTFGGKTVTFRRNLGKWEEQKES